MIDHNALEEKWIKRWQEQKLFESNPYNDKKCFITVAYPYPNSPQHIGHGRTYTLADVHARYMRMKGYNVLFPMAFHYTGTPILAMSKRVADNDEELINTFLEIYKVPEEEIPKFVEPLNIAKYFHNEIKQGMIEMGYSIDWRREFTTIDGLYKKFIEWQFKKLREKGYIIQGSHPVGWCPRDNNPVSQHDTLGDVEPEFNEYTLIKFEYDDIKIPTATLRPETIFGVTNLWINPDSIYIKVSVDNEVWIISKKGAEKLRYLNRSVEIIEQLKGIDLLNIKVKVPIDNREVEILPASFVDPDNGTGIVMSVPAHAPYDYQALIDLKIDLKPIVIIESEKYKGKVPAYEIIKAFNVKDQDDPKLENATTELYSHEFYNGIMMNGKYAGKSVREARELVKEDLIRDKKADTMLELVKSVRCRCGAECVVKILDDQWFIDYSKREWKDLAHKCINAMRLLPEDIRKEFEYTIEWLRERACARRSGLGTNLPWDKDWIIESLSDSVIYMAYYIIAKYANKIDHEKIDEQFFDYIFYGEGDVNLLVKRCNIDRELIESIKNEFEYYYPVDSRHSGRDLIPNHLTFFIFNHIAIFPREKWPKEIVVNGSVLMEGKKMSKSMGNIIPLRKVIKEYGADAIRTSIMITAELLQDADFTFDILEGIKNRLEKIYNASKELKDHTSNDRIDRWLESILQHKIANITSSMDKLRVREALHEIIYGMDEILEWYEKRKKAKGGELSLRTFFDARVRMLAPFAPFITEEIWAMFGNKNSITKAEWPRVDKQKIDYEADEGEILIMNLLEDIQNILKVTKMKPSTIYIYTASKDKHELYAEILRLIIEGKRNFKDIMRELINSDKADYAKKMPQMIKKMVDDILAVSEEVRDRKSKIILDERSVIEDAKELLANEFNAKVMMYDEEDIIDPKSRARTARPYKPALYIE